MTSLKPPSTLVTLCDTADPLNSKWIDVGLMPAVISQEEVSFVSVSQQNRLRRLANTHFRWDIGPQLPDDLFSPAIVTALGPRSCLAQGAGIVPPLAESVWIQLLPLWVDSISAEENGKLSWHELDLNGYRAYSLDSELNNRAQSSRARFQQLSSSRSTVFARSANYMGSKAALANQILDVLDATEPSNSTMIDLMCGSGAMSGAFARRYPTIASDAQEFCRLLGVVHGGGMSRSKGKALAESVVQLARTKYESLSSDSLSRIEKEDTLLNSELTPTLLHFVSSMTQSRAIDWESRHLGSEAAVTAAWTRGELITHLYGGVFFGERQATEIDCLRQSIAKLEDKQDRDWALGALVCAASACALTYGGHFAQPKLDVSTSGLLRGDIAEALQQRALSVTHEFFIRLTSLAEESERVNHQVCLVAGPWQAAINNLAARKPAGPMCVYVDPPYTRDEYSRYYHVLEAIVLYRPQAVSGKGRLPARGSPGRFASEFYSRRPELIEQQIANVLQSCLSNGWNCLWSYSNSGTASITKTLDRLEGIAKSAEVFRMDHSYKAQGRRSAKRVSEYAVHLRPAGNKR